MTIGVLPRILNLKRSHSPHDFQVPVSMPRFTVRLFSIFGLAFVVALQTGPTGSTDVYGACGDYVHLGRHTEPSHSAAGGDETADLEMAERERQPIAPPCHGPTCRSEAPAPTAPAPVRNSNGPDQNALLASAVPELPVARQRISFAVIVVPDEWSRLRLERPPRRRS